MLSCAFSFEIQDVRDLSVSVDSEELLSLSGELQELQLEEQTRHDKNPDPEVFKFLSVIVATGRNNSQISRVLRV